MTDDNDTDKNADDEANNVYHLSYEPATDSVSEELLQAVATLNDADPSELALLIDTIDPEALDALFQARSNGRVIFEYEDYRIRVTADGTIAIESLSPGGDG